MKPRLIGEVIPSGEPANEHQDDWLENEMQNIAAGIVTIILGVSSPLLSRAEQKGFCERNYGESAAVWFEPEESNAIGVADSITGAAYPVKKPGTPKPVGFRCLQKKAKEAGSVAAKSCRGGTKYEKIGQEEYCGSKSYSIKKLCPDELRETWPELISAVCKPK